MAKRIFDRVVVTGTTSGIGFEAAAQLAEEGCATVAITGRTTKRANDARDALVDRTAKEVFVPVGVDLGSSSQVDAATNDLLQDPRPIDLVILNAGMIPGKARTLTKEGVEITAASSLVGHHRLLMGLLNSKGLSPDARIVIAGSEAARGDVPIMKLMHFPALAAKYHDGHLSAAAEALLRGTTPTNYSSLNTYAHVKLMVAWWAAALARRLPDGITVNAVSPGAAPHTDAGRNTGFMMRRVMSPMMKMVPSSLGMGASTAQAAHRYLEAAQFGRNVSGEFFASPPKKMSGTLTLMTHPHLQVKAHQEATWEATCVVADATID